MPGRQSVSDASTPGLQLTSKHSTGPQAAAAAALDEEASVAASRDVIPEMQEFLAPSLTEQALRLLQALVAGHDQVGIHGPSVRRHQSCWPLRACPTRMAFVQLCVYVLVVDCLRHGSVGH